MKHGGKSGFKVLRMFKFVILMLFSGLLNANCVVLLYHNFSDNTPKSTSVTPELFEKHLQYLQNNDFKVLSLKSMLKRLDEDSLPNKCVVLTADDAYRSIAENAYPLLKKYQMSMSVFAATHALDKKYNAMMSWEIMRDIQGKNMQFYNHTTHHPHLLDLNKMQVQKQIAQAQDSLEKTLNQQHKFFAYPYGEASLSILKQVKQLGYSAFGQQSGVVSKHSNRQYIPRFPMAAQYAEISNFITKVNTLAMPIKAQTVNPIFTKNPPTLTLNFIKSLNKYQKSNFSCFANGGVNLIWQDNKTVRIIAKKRLTHRRSKYNCTMPSGEKSRYYWYSVQWINPKIAE